mmetsp:Transcript_41385/g.56401  ORF Transcript_41385/g.56401 Transcript_41385/m.56401 type:complete len:136 (-) Transcript_41385:215-622(-)
MHSTKEAGQVMGIMKKKAQERGEKTFFDGYDSGEESSDSIETDDDESSPLLLSSKPDAAKWRARRNMRKRKEKQKAAASFLTRVCSVQHLSLRLPGLPTTSIMALSRSLSSIASRSDSSSLSTLCSMAPYHKGTP